jgi:hypothetical protein
VDSQEVMRAYLQRIGQLPLAENGPDRAGGREGKHPDEKDNEFIRDLIQQQSKVNRRALVFAFSLIAVVFFSSVFTAIRAGGSVGTVLSIGGVGGGFEAGLLAWASRLWKEYNKFGFLLILSRGLSPEDLMKTVGAMFFAQSARKKEFAAGGVVLDRFESHCSVRAPRPRATTGASRHSTSPMTENQAGPLGSRIYFNDCETGGWRIAQVSVTGGQTGQVSTRLANPRGGLLFSIERS